MNDKIEITEVDIFKFVFSRQNLSKDKIDYLLLHEDRFRNEIAFCKEISNFDENDLNPVFEKLISHVNSVRKIELFPQEPLRVEEVGVKLAAAAVLTETPRKAVSFTDQELKYLVRTVKNDSKILLYLFTDDKHKNEFEITIYPSESRYKISDISKPIEINPETVIEKIVIS